MPAKIVIGLGFGDEGKGTIVDYLAKISPTKPLVVRFSGGSQAAHNVINENGFHHTFSQFGSGTLRHAQTLLSRNVLVNPLRLYAESLPLTEFLGRDSMDLVAIDERAPLVTKIHQAVNRAREIARGSARHGSTGQGMGDTELYRITFPDLFPTIGDLYRPSILTEKLKRLEAWGETQVGKLDISLTEVLDELLTFAEDHKLNVFSPSEVNQIVANTRDLIFEGSQGVLLDEWVGFHPHTTWSTVTPRNALTILREAGLSEDVQKIGVTRTYTTRHGAGPFPSEDTSLEFSETHNGHGQFQGDWRVGTLDLTLLSYAAAAVKPDLIALTHMDVEQTKVAKRYDSLFDFEANVRNAENKDLQTEFTKNLSAFHPETFDVRGNSQIKDLISQATLAPVKILSHGPESSAKRNVD